MRKVLSACADGWVLCGHNQRAELGSPQGSVMSCQSLAARPYDDADSPCTVTFHRSVRFSSDSRSQPVRSNDAEVKRETPGSISLTVLAGSAAQASPLETERGAVCRFPKLEECAHFHYERVALGGLRVELLPDDESPESPATAADDDEEWVWLRVRSHVASPEVGEEARPLSASWSEGSDVREWTLARSRDNFLQLDDMLHRCIYDRRVSGLPELRAARARGADWRRLVADYVHHLSIIADDSINCGPALNWFQMDNKGHKLLVANEDSSSINTPAVAAAYSVRKYVSQARDEISFDVGDMISIIDMPGPQESLWWRGKRGFRVGFFPHNCVAVIGDKVPRHMTQPPPIVGSVAVAPIKPVLRKHGKLISLFRSFILSRPSRRSLKRQGILRERVFGCDLGEHLLNCGRDVPAVLEACAAGIERRGAVDGVYRLSGGAALTQRLRAAFDAAAAPPTAEVETALQRDPHALASLLKTYFRELPNPLCTYRLYDSFVSAVQRPTEAERLRAMRDTVAKLPPPHYRTLAHLARHLRRVSLLAESTGMTARNMAIVWAPNLLRSPHPQHALQGVAVQAVVTEFLICYAEDLFAGDQADDSGPDSLDMDNESEVQVELRGAEPCRRPKSLPVNPPTKLLSLEEARRRGRAGGGAAPPAPPAPAPCGTIAAAARTQLRPASHLRPKYIEVGSGPNNLPQYHTVLDLPLPGTKRALKRSPSGWRGLFSRSKQQRPRAVVSPPAAAPPPPAVVAAATRAKSCESLTSEPDALAPLSPARGERGERTTRAHARSASCDSYFEPWQAELAGMRLRLSPQERDRHMFSEEDDAPPPQESWCSSPASGPSAEPSPRRPPPDLAERKRVALERLERQVAQLGYIDHEPEPAQPAPGKRLCTDRDSPQAPAVVPAPASAAAPAAVSVKLRERNSPRKQKNGGRYSAMQSGGEVERPARLTWHGRDHHATRIAVHWPERASPAASPAASPTASLVATPVTPRYDPLDSDSETSGHTRTITVGACRVCDRGQCLECELRAADPPRLSRDCSGSNLDSSADVSYRQLDRLSAVSGSSASDRRDTVASSRPGSSIYSNGSLKPDEPDDGPDYVDLSDATSHASPASPPRSPLKSTISITFRSPSKSESADYEPLGEADTPTNERDSAYEDSTLERSLAIVEEAPVPVANASLPAQEARQPIDPAPAVDLDVYSQVKFFKKSIEEVNAMILETPEAESAYENVDFDRPELRVEALATTRDDGHANYENVRVEGPAAPAATAGGTDDASDNGNLAPVSVRELAVRFESPTDEREPLSFERVERVAGPDAPATSPNAYRLTKNSTARSLDENAFVKEFGGDEGHRGSFEARETRRRPRFLPDLNLNTEEPEPKPESVTPTTENKICLVQRFDARKPDLRNLIGFDAERKLSRERIEKYKEERRNFLREKYGSQSFRSGPEQLTRLKLRREAGGAEGAGDGEPPAFERRNTVDLGQRARLTLARSATDLAPPRKEKVSPSYNIRDMAAMFEQRSQSNSNG